MVTALGSGGRDIDRVVGRVGVAYGGSGRGEVLLRQGVLGVRWPLDRQRRPRPSLGLSRRDAHGGPRRHDSDGRRAAIPPKPRGSRADGYDELSSEKPRPDAGRRQAKKGPRGSPSDGSVGAGVGVEGDSEERKAARRGGVGEWVLRVGMQVISCNYDDAEPGRGMKLGVVVVELAGRWRLEKQRCQARHERRFQETSGTARWPGRAA